MRTDHLAGVAPGAYPQPVTAPDPAGPVARATDLAARLLEPQAERVDAEGVTRGLVDELAAAGLLGLTGPRGYGGADAPPAVVREVTEILAGASGAAWFVGTQHAMPVQTLSRSDNVALKERHLRAMCTGGSLAGIALAHVRRPGPPPVTATRSGAGWCFDGHVAWTTSWGIADLLLLAGVSGSGELVLALVPARGQPGLRASAPLRLAAMQGTSTVRLTLDGLLVGDADIAEVGWLEQWLAADRLRTANCAPAVFGLLRNTTRRLAQLAQRRCDATAGELARRLHEEGEDLRGRAYALVDHVPPDEQLADRLALRAVSLDVAVRATTALIVASGGGAMSLDAAPQRLAREAMFHLVQMQTAPVREATLQRLLDATA